MKSLAVVSLVLVALALVAFVAGDLQVHEDGSYTLIDGSAA
jgi:hypothetical protein